MFRLPHRFAALALPLVWIAVLIACRIGWTGTRHYGFLGWNLILASVPVAAATLFSRASRTRGGTPLAVASFALWLLFLPNAFYVVTDLQHLYPQPPVPYWYDLALVASAACTGLLLGYRALRDVHRALAERLGARASWAIVVATTFLCGFGVYLGRYQRWNSWDALTDPRGVLLELFARAGDPLAHPRTLGVTLVYGGALLVGYVALHAIHGSSESRAEAPRAGAPRG